MNNTTLFLEEVSRRVKTWREMGSFVDSDMAKHYAAALFINVAGAQVLRRSTPEGDKWTHLFIVRAWTADNTGLTIV